MDPITIGLLVAAGAKGLFGLGKSIAGGVQKAKANKELKKATPKYTRPAEYGKLLSIYEQQAGLGQLPGQEGIEADISARTARGSRAVGKYADNPVAAAALTAGLYGQEQQAIRDLGIQFADFKNKNMMALAEAHKMGADYSDKEFSYNKWYPDQMRRNMAAQKWNAGQQNLWNGIDQFGGAIVDTIGIGAGAGWFDKKTPAAAEMSGGSFASNPTGEFSVGSADPTSAYKYYNPNLAGQFLPQFGTRVPTPNLGAEWGK